MSEMLSKVLPIRTSLVVTLSVFISLIFPLYQIMFIFSIKCFFIPSIRTNMIITKHNLHVSNLTGVCHFCICLPLGVYEVREGVCRDLWNVLQAGHLLAAVTVSISVIYL